MEPDVSPSDTKDGPAHNDVTKTGLLTSTENETTKKGDKCRFFKKLPPLRVMLILAACVMVEFILGVSYTTGNMMPYLTSYLRNVTGETSVDYTTTLWVDNTVWLVVYVGTPLLGLLEGKMSEKLYLIIGTAAIGLSFFGSYWAVQTSFAMMVLVYGILHGVGQAVLWPVAVNIAIRWFPAKKGLVGACVMTGYGAGAFAWNQLITNWINPDNLQPDIQVGEDVYFTQQEVLHNVPSYYLLMGGVLTGLLLLCVVLIASPRSHTVKELTEPHDNHSKSMVFQNEKMLTVDHNDRQLQDVDWNNDVSANGKVVTATAESGLAEESSLNPKLDVKRKDSGVSETEKTNVDGPRDYTPMEVIRSRVAWTIWFLHLFLGASFVFVWAFYKAYGQTFIHNDHFLALVGSFASVFNAVGRPFWGWLADKIGYQPTIMICQIILGTGLATFLVCEYVGPAMFFAWVCLMYLAISGYYALQAPLVFALFGSKYFTYSVGVVYSSGTIYFLLPVFVVSAIKGSFGWHGVFLLGAALAFTSLIFNVSLLIDCGHPIPAHMKKELFFSHKRRSAESKGGGNCFPRRTQSNASTETK